MSFAEYAFPFAGALPQFDLQPVQSLPRPSDIEGDTTQELTPSSAERDVAGSALTPKGDRSNEKCPPQENEPVPRWFCEFRKRPALFDSLMHCGVIGILALWLSIPLNTPDGDADTSNYWIFILGFFTLYHFTGSYNAYCLNRQFDPFGFSSKRLLYTGEILNSVLPICLSVLAYFLPSEWRRAVTSSKIWFVYLVTAGLFPISIAYFLHCLLARRVYETNLSPEELSRDRAKPWGDAFADLRRPVPLKVVFWFIVATMLVIATFVVGQVYSYLFFRYYPLPTWLAVGKKRSLCCYAIS
ncbi:hypothetical protein BC832DRAFT_563427 [Gaertneriomyces semiglobifer]|nr:hypothetical protein BC832DRAFT_563427 [Gaertneriomyces semiglobifer]